MVQIEKRKKKGRPSKADLAARRAAEEAGVSPSSAAAEAEVRRSLRRRSFRYSIIDYDEDYLDDDVVSDEDNINHNNRNHNNEVDDDDDDVEDDVSREVDDDDEDDESDRRRRKRRGKKVKLVVKLNNSNSSNYKKRREEEDDEDEEEEEEEEDERVVKKRRINRDDDDDEVDVENDEDDEGRDGKEEAKEEDDVSEIPNDEKSSYNHDGNTPLPDKKQLELMLDKLQKKDTYGVYAEPVDPEELPDYHDVIDHPMDFSTVRKKLASDSYSTLEQFESDVFLISSNAMQYNAPETVYHKQARAIKELAEKKFQRIRLQIERLEKEPKPEPKSEPKFEPKSEQKEKSYSVIKKQTKKLFYRGTQEQLGSDFSSGATLASTDAPNMCGTEHTFERPGNNDGPIEGILSLPDNNLEKAEDAQLGKCVLPKFGRRSFVVDENRRATYNISNQPEDRSESIFTTFEGDKKQLIPVGLPGEFAYARSLARFAANLGPKAWGVASKRIEQVLPPGLKHGRGWIGEYEPLPTTVLFVEHRKDPFASRLCNAVDFKKDDLKDPIVSRSNDAVCSKKDDRLLEGRAQANVHQVKQPSSNETLPAMFGSRGAKPHTPTNSISRHQNPFSKGSEHVMIKESESNCPSTNSRQSNHIFQQQNRLPRDSICPENMGAKRVEPNSPSISDHKRDYNSLKQLPHGMEIGKKVETNSHPTSEQKTDNIPHRQPRCMEVPASIPSDSFPKGKNFLQSLPFKKPDTNGGAPDGLSNGKVENNFIASNRAIPSSPRLMSPQLHGAPVPFPQRQDQGLSDPVLVMKMLTERAQKQQNGSINAHNPAQTRPSVPSPRGDAGGNAAAAAASAWMSVGSTGFRPAAQNSATNRSQISSDSTHNATRMFYPQAMHSNVEYPVSSAMHFPPEKMGLPFQSFVPQPTKVGIEAQVPSRPVALSQVVTNDLSRFQVQAPWRGLSPHTQPKQKQDTLPPDLNVAFQSSVDSQQPDLALQL